MVDDLFKTHNFVGQSRAAGYAQRHGLVQYMKAIRFLSLFLSYRQFLTKEPGFSKEYKDYFGKEKVSESKDKWIGKDFKDLSAEEQAELIKETNEALRKAKLLKEGVIQDEFVERVCRLFKLSVVCNKMMDNKLIPDAIFRALHANDGDAPQIVIEMKSFSQKANLLRDIDQLTAYVMHLLAIYPKLSFLKIILTDGWTFYYGHVQRKSHSRLEIIMIEDPYTLYKYVCELYFYCFSIF